MRSPIKKAVVLGAGTMGAPGAQEAANAAASGLMVSLLDIVPDGASEANLLFDWLKANGSVGR